MNPPFPGMDPYLESSANWSGFHHHLAEELMTALPGDPTSSRWGCGVAKPASPSPWSNCWTTAAGGRNWRPATIRLPRW